MDPREENIGLSTKDALHRLCKDIEHTVSQFNTAHSKKHKRSWLQRSCHQSSHYTNINWISALFLLLCAFSLLLVYVCSDEQDILIYEALLIVALLSVAVFIELYDNKLRQHEIADTVSLLVKQIQGQINTIKWNAANYPELGTPYSPCVTLQWTYRDNRVVNLPWALLVKDDIIIVRPGQHSPGYCEALDKCDIPLLHAKEVYGPSLQNANEIFSIPKARKPLENRKYRLLETPYLDNLKVALEQGVDRPITPNNKQRHLLMIKVIERILLPVVGFLILVINFVRFMYLESTVGKASVLDLFLVVPTSTLLPLLPIFFPIAWNVLNYIGMAIFKSLFEQTIDTTSTVDSTTELFDDADAKTDILPKTNIDYKSVWNHFKSIMMGRSSILPRTANILHVLGSVTALCCVDKKGILSWPNPTAEKVFFLHNSDNISDTSSLANLNDLNTDGDKTADAQFQEDAGTSIAEVLDVTYNPKDPFKLHFDDMKWHKHLNSLKPLGLAILLNTCNKDTQTTYMQFCSHITCEAMYNENLVPVTNRRCLCELAREIGFVEQAQKIFSLEQQLSTFRHLQPEMVRRDNKYARSLSMSTKLKFPFPHMFAVVVKELSSGSIQLLSQGTADIILDSCVDYWDGYDLCPLTPGDRKKIQDFYQRCSLTAYCTAFAYRPLSKAVSDKLSHVYLELPSDSRHLYQCHRSPTPVHWECRSVLEPKIRTALGPFYSTDSLLYNEPPNSEVQDADSCFDMQCNQVLIGMVTMQYQAQADMVHLIEQLERACIRFVHFSKENELRSRVFSEKMGLESGWNCHISLLSDRNSNLESSRTMSFSAPSAINTEQTVVKFDNEVHSLAPHDEELSQDEHDDDKDQHDWQSLSCLTDSTDHSAPINFDMSNRAKLPRGIDKIRPHIELIDNVPLLVSLFTDCTPSSTKEMLHIMQDYGEVVCVMGSSANNENMGIFLQADASIGVEPIYPQTCQTMETCHQTVEGMLSPIDISRYLNSIACSLSLKREHPISIFHLVMVARHYMWNLWNTTQFWVSCCISLSIMQLAAALLMLPALLTPGHVLWSICVVIPILSISLMGTKTDPEIMKKPQEKNQIVFNAEVATFVLWFYGAKFLPAIFAVLITFSSILSAYCSEICTQEDCTCLLYYLPTQTANATFTGGWVDTEHSFTLRYAQNICVLVAMLHFVVISVGFVHREHNIWARSPHTNILWVVAMVALVLLQAIYSFVNVVDIPSAKQKYFDPLILIFVFLSPLLTFAIAELVKRHEIKMNLRQQRRIRLEFGTKLGMNSPF
ncbi:transmembrane protein 94 isoform X2 [Atheta coriaria]|uniref:transmembrane protein 94 isoform X2 n=1 Tax=Dalotia coriaria TaxID=877792 RepID=UPI0031F36D03